MLRDDFFTVGVTGTNGKTTTTSWLASLLRERSPHVASVTTLGSFLDGEKLTVPPRFEGLMATMRRCAEKGGNASAVEYTSEALAAGVGRAWPADVGVFTNLSHDHLDAHASLEHYLASKAQLFVTLREKGAAVLNGCDENAELLGEVVPAGRRKLLYGLASRGAAWGELDLVARDVRVSWNGTDVELAASALVPTACTLHVSAIGLIFAENALAALGGALASGIDVARAIEVLAKVPVPPGRFERVAASPNVVVDYAHSPDALRRTLTTACALATKQVVVVFGAGGNRDKAKRPLLGEAASAADRIILTSDNPRDESPASIAVAIRDGIDASKDVIVELDRAKAIERALADANDEDVIVIAGKGHEAAQIAGGVAKSFSDRDVAIATLAKLGRGNRPRMSGD